MEENAIIQPEEDYEAWCFIFLTAVQPDGDSFTVLVPSYINLINNIINTDKLPDPISDFTSDFLDNFVPDVVNKVLERGYVNQNDVEKINLFLITTSDLIPWAASHGKFHLVKQIFSVISQETNSDSKIRNSNDIPKPNYQYYNRSFYSLHPNSWKLVLKHYIDICIPLLVSQCVEPASSFYPYYLIFYIVSDTCIKEVAFNENIQKPAIESFLKFLENLDVHNISDIPELHDCIKNYITFVLHHFKPLIPPLIELSEKFIKSGILDKQFLGIEAITKISESTDSEAVEFFTTWTKKTDLADYILSKSFNNSFYERIRPIMVKLMSKELLEKFWNSALIAHRSQRKPMFDILSKAIVSVDEQSSIEFINYVIITASSPQPSQVSLQSASSSSSSTVSSTSLLTPLSSSESILSIMSSPDIFNSPSSQNLIGTKLDIDIFQFLANVARSFASTNQKLAEYVTEAIFKLGLMPSNRKIASECLTSICKLKEIQMKLFTLCCQQLLSFEIIEFICRILNELIDTSNNLPLAKLKAIILRIVSQSKKQSTATKDQAENKKDQAENKEDQAENKNGENKNDNENDDENKGDQSKNDENKGDQSKNDENKADQSKNDENNDENDDENIENIQLNENNVLEMDQQQFQEYKILLCNLFYKTLKKSKLPITKKIVDAFSQTGIDDSLFSMLLMNLKTLGVEAFGEDVNQFLLEKVIQTYNFAKASETFSDFFLYFIIKINIEKNNIELVSKYQNAINLNPNKFTIVRIPLDHIDLLIKLYCEIESESNISFLMKQLLQIFTQLSIQTDLMMQYLDQLITPYITNVNERSTYRILMLIKSLLSLEKFYYIELFGRSRHIPTNFDNYIEINFKIKQDQNNIIKSSLKVLPNAPARSVQEQIGILLSLVPKYIYLYKSDNTYLNPASSLNELKVKNGDSIKVTIAQEIQFEFTFPSISLTNLEFQSKLLNIINNNDYEKVTKLAVDILNTLPDATSLLSVSIDDIKNSQSGYSFLYKLEIYTKKASKLDSKNSEFFLELMNQENNNNNPFNILSINEETSRKIACEALKFVYEKFDQEFLCNSFDRIVLFCLKILLKIKLDQPSYDNNQRNAILLLNKIIKVDPTIATEVSLKNIGLIEKVMVSTFSDQNNLMHLIDFFDKLEDIRPIFDICISHLNQQSNSDNFVKIFSHIVSNVVDFVNLDDVFTKCLNSLNSNFNQHIFCEICKAIEALIKTDSSFAIKYGSDLVTKLISIAFDNDDPNIHSAAFSICETVCSISKESMETAIKILKPHFEKNYDFYSFKPSNNTRSHLNFTGLRNLGSTCYMNSIFQQLFYVPPFRYRIITEDFTKYEKTKVQAEIDNNADGNKAVDSYVDENIEAHIRFQYLFSEMLLTKRKACDTQPFCSVWKGWAKQLINPREQQDAFEFLQIFIDQFPSSINKYFRGTIKNTIKGENFETSNLEQFYTFCLAIQNCANITDAFKNFLQSETFPQYKTDDGRVIDAQKFARINEAPPVLVLQLKRFEYDLRTWERIKINDRCQFDYTLNIREFMENPNEDVIYQLTGVVLHAGTALGGHYTSVVNLNRRWVYFNDQEVSFINNNEFQKLAFGGNSKNNEFDAEPCAFLLFYTRAHSEWNGISFFEDAAKEQDFSRFLPNHDENQNENGFLNPNLVKTRMSDLIKPEIKEQIEKDNTEFIGLQCTFSQQMFSFVMTIDDPFLLISFFINIFCHSGIEMGIKAQKTIKQSIVKLNESQLNEVFQYLIANNDKIDNILCQCTLTDVTDSLTNVIYSCYYKLQPEKAVEYIEHFFKVMISVIKNWRQIPQFAHIIYEFVLTGDEHAKVAIERDWIMKLINFISLVYEGQKSSVVLNNVDLSDIILTIQILIEKAVSNEDKFNVAIKELQTMISQYSNQILSSQSNLNSFISLISQIGDKIRIDMSHILSLLATKEIDDQVFNTILASTIEKAKTAEQAKGIIRSITNLKGYKITARGCIAFLCKLISEENNQQIRSFFLTFPEETILTLAFESESTIRQASEGICAVLFNKSVKVSPDMKTYIAINSRSNDTNDNQVISDNYEFNNEAAKEEMNQLYGIFLNYLDEFIIDNVEALCYSKENNTNNYSMTENVFKLVSFLRIFKWFLLCLHSEDDILFGALNLLFQECVKMDYQLDYNLMFLCDILALFDSNALNDFAVQCLKDMFRFINDIQPYYAKLLIIHFWKIARKVSIDVFIELLKDELFAISIQQLLSNYTTEKTKIIPEFEDRINTILGRNDSNSKMVVKTFILSILDVENLQKMIDNSLDILFNLLVLVIDDVQPNVILTFLINLISFIVKDSYNIGYDPTRAKVFEKIKIMFYFVKYINKTGDFAFPSLTIKYNQLTEFIIGCASICRSPYEHEFEAEKNTVIRSHKKVDNNFLHYSSIEYLSPTVKELIGLKETGTTVPTATTTNSAPSAPNSNNNNDDDDAVLNAGNDSIDSVNDFNHDSFDEDSAVASASSSTDENNRVVRKRKPAPPVGVVTMDFIYLIAFFGMKYPPFLESVMTFFNDSIQKKKKRDRLTATQATRAWAFLCLHVTRIEIVSARCSSEVKNLNEVINDYYNKFEAYLNQIVSASRSSSQKALAIVFDFINAQIIELKYKRGIQKVKGFDVRSIEDDDELMLAFFVKFIKTQTFNKFRIESITSPHIAEFFAFGLRELSSDNVKSLFSLTTGTLLSISVEANLNPLLQKLWLILRVRPDMLSIFREIFAEKNSAKNEGSQIKRDLLESKSMNGLANLIFGKTKADQNDDINLEEEDKSEKDVNDIFDDFKAYANTEEDEYDVETIQTIYNNNRILRYYGDDSSEDDEIDTYNRDEYAVMMETFGVSESDHSRLK